MAKPQVSRDKSASAKPAVPRGRFVWHELLANDQSVATSFYTRVLGWTTEAWKTPPGAPPYTMWSNAGKPFGGLMALPSEARSAGAPSHWLGYVTVPDADGGLAQARKLGAKALMGPMDIPEVGRMAVIADPQGAVIALFTPNMPDADGGLAQARKLGAKALMGPMDIPEVGRMAGIADPQGAVIAPFTPHN